MKISANELRNRDVIIVDKQLYKVDGTPEHIKPGKGPAYIQVCLRSIDTKSKLSKRFRSSNTFDKAHIDVRSLQYIYSEKERIVLMDQESFDQIEIDKALLGDKIAFLSEGMILEVSSFENRVVDVFLPDLIETTIIDTAPYMKGATITSSFKRAKVAGGKIIHVPQYLVNGDIIVVKTECESFVRRAKE